MPDPTLTASPAADGGRAPARPEEVCASVVNIWDLIHDPDMPSDVIQRALTRNRARALGLPPAPIPDEDLPHLARHAQEVP